MGLVVQTNNAANTALKHLNTNSIKMNQSLERLSSGFRVNSAADDAAGFAISSKLDAQSGRLKAAATNVAQAQAMVKTADAGVNEIQNMVTRLQVLATQAESANNDGERNRLDGERSKLESAIDKIASSTKYNSVSLLDGSAGVTVASNTFTSLEGLQGVTLDGASASTTFSAYLQEAAGTSAGTFGAGDKITLSDGTTSQTVTVASLATGLSTVDLNFGDLGVTLTVNSALTGQTTNAAGATTTAIGNVVTSAAAANTFQIGADNNANNRIDVAFNNNYTTTGLSIT
ncbi:MAG: flagellar protein, partial [Mariprofundaceae bacterium]|nr:flagellar protein [Mariprofundaceae bacterium]